MNELIHELLNLEKYCKKKLLYMKKKYIIRQFMYNEYLHSDNAKAYMSTHKLLSILYCYPPISTR